MALLPNTIVYGATGNDSTPTEKIGGVVVGITSATTTTVGSPVTTTKTLLNLATPHGKVRPLAHTNPTGVYTATTALSAGTFAYEQSAYMVMRLGSAINGTASTALLFAANGNIARRNLREKAFGAKTSTAFRAGYWQPLATTGRSKWSTAPSAQSNNYVLPTNSGSNSADQGMYVTFMSVPGELTYMYGGANPLQDEYAAVYG